MVPFMVQAFDNVPRNLCNRFERKDFMENSNTVHKLLKVDFTDKANQVSPECTDLGFAIKHKIQILKKSGKLKDNHLCKLAFGTLEFLVKSCTRFTEKNPLKNKLVISASCLSPKLILELAQLTLKLLDKMLEILVGLKKTTSAIEIEARNEYSKFLSSLVKTNKEVFLEYDETKDRLDSFLWKFIGLKSRIR